VFADSRYSLWVDGSRLSDGPTRFDYRAPQYDSIHLTGLSLVTHTLVIVVHNFATCGSSNIGAAPAVIPEVCPVLNPAQWWLDTPSGRFQNHLPGLTAALVNSKGDLILTTDSAWRASSATRYRPSRAVWGSVSDSINGLMDGGVPSFLGNAFDDSAWSNATRGIDGRAWGPLTPLDTPRQRTTALPPLQAVWPPGTSSWPLRLSSDTAASAILDIGSQALARFDVTLTASSPGLVISLSYYQRFSGQPGGLSHGLYNSSYTAAGGGSEEVFSTLDLFGGRYVLVQVDSGTPPWSVVVMSINATDVRYPLLPIASFNSTSPTLNRLFTMALRTVSINSADAYTDTPMRERAEWVGDATTNTYNCTRLAFATQHEGGGVLYSDPGLLKGVLVRAALSGRSAFPNFFTQKAHTCSDRMDFNAVWTDQTMAWVTGLSRYLAVTGDTFTVASLYPDVRAFLLQLLARSQSQGLLSLRETIFFTDPLFLYTFASGSMNSWAYAALCDGAAIAAALNATADAAHFSLQAQQLKAALVDRLWNSTVGAFNAGLLADTIDATGIGLGGGSGTSPFFPAGGQPLTLPDDPRLGASYFATMIAVAKGVLDGVGGDEEPLLAEALHWLMHPSAPFPTPPLRVSGAPMATMHQFAALLGRAGGVEGDALALQIMEDAWADMVAMENEVGTLWEFFDDSGELAHDMGAVPLVFLLERVLGVTLTLPFSATTRKLTVEPHVGSLGRVSGVVGTEFGPVGVFLSMEGIPGPLSSRVTHLHVNASLAALTPQGPSAYSQGTSLVNATLALPLAAPGAPPPTLAELSFLCWSQDGGAWRNVSQAVTSGELRWDASGLYLRFSWSPQGTPVPSPGPEWLGGRPLPGLTHQASTELVLKGGGACAT